MKHYARMLYHFLLGVRRFLACRLLAGLERAGTDRRQHYSLLWHCAFALYFCKRFVQECLTNGPPLRRGEFGLWKREITTQFLSKLHLAATRPIRAVFSHYPKHRENNRLLPWEAEAMRRLAEAFDYRPLISVLVPVYNSRPEWLERLVQSIQDQTYDRWELVLVDDGSSAAETIRALQQFAERDERIVVERLPANQGVSRATNRAADLAHGEFLAFVDHDDELLPDALWWIVERLQREPDCDLLYTDEEYVPACGAAPYVYFKPDFSPEHLTAYNYICHLLVVRKRQFEAAGRLRHNFDGAQDHDLILRLIQRTRKVAHIPRVLYRWHIVPASLSRFEDPATRQLRRVARLDRFTGKAVQDYLDERRLPATAGVTPMGWALPVYDPVDHGKVSIIICTRDNPRLLARCLRSIETTTDYPNYEIVIVDNGSRTWRARWQLRRLRRRHRVLSIPSGPDGFNFARLNNEAAGQVDGKYLLFLNDDTKVLTDYWLSALVGTLQFPEVGAAGARLLFPNRKAQHVGLIVGAMGWGPWHALRDIPADSDGANGYMTYPHNCLAVTGACLMTPRQLFLAQGGFNETEFGVSFNDVDYCLRLHAAGLRSVYVPQAELIHYESQSRGRVINTLEAAALRQKYRVIQDPYWNPNYSRLSATFMIEPRRQARGLWPEPKPHVLVVGRPSQPGDPWPAWEPLFEALEERGLCTYAALPVVDPATADWQAELTQAAAEFEAEVVFVQGQESVGAIEQAHRLGLPSVWHLPQQLLAPRNPDPRQSLDFVRVCRALPLPYQVIFNNLHAISWATTGCPRDNFGVIDGVLFDDPATSPSVAEQRASLRNRWALSAERTLLLSIVPREEIDSLDCLLAAYSRLKATQRQRTFLLLVCQGEVEATVAHALRQKLSSVGPDIGLIVETGDVCGYLAAADVFVAHPTIDLRPRSVLAALAFGLPIIGVDHLVRSDLMHVGATGFGFRRYSARGLRRALSRLLARPARLGNYGRQSRGWLDSRAHPEKVLEDWAAVLREAAELSPRRTLPIVPATIKLSQNAGSVPASPNLPLDRATAGARAYAVGKVATAG